MGIWGPITSILLFVFLAYRQEAVEGTQRRAENSVIRSTLKGMDLYFEGRKGIGNTPTFPFLCYSFLSKKREYSFLENNVEVFGKRCEWILTLNVAGGLLADPNDIDLLARKHGTSIIQQDRVNSTVLISKTLIWKNIVWTNKENYSHMFFIDADIEFSAKQLNHYLHSWICGSVVGSPPLISQPTIIAGHAGRKQDYLEVNHFGQYDGSKLSLIGTEVVENQVVLIDTAFLFWYYKEVLTPWFEKKIPNYNETDWGLSRTWCKAAIDYKKLFNHWHKGKRKAVSSPQVCGIIPHPVVHQSTHSISKNRAFIYQGMFTNFALRKIFPVWSAHRIVKWDASALILEGNYTRQNYSLTGKKKHAEKTKIKWRSDKNERDFLYTCTPTVYIKHNETQTFFWL